MVEEALRGGGGGVQLHRDPVKNSQAGGWRAARGGGGGGGDSGKGKPVVDQLHWVVHFECV